MQSKVHPTYKTKYRVANWTAYNQALVRRGDVTVWLSSDAIAAWTPRRSGRRGGQRRYSDLAIETALTLRLLYHLPLRQAEGFLHALFGMMRLDLSAPDYTTRVKIRYLPEFIGLMARLSPPYDTLSRAERGSPRAGGRKERRPCRHSRDRFAARDPSRWERRGGSDRQDWRDGAEPDRVPQGYQPRGGMPHGILAISEFPN